MKGILKLARTWGAKQMERCSHFRKKTEDKERKKGPEKRANIRRKEAGR